VHRFGVEDHDGGLTLMWALDDMGAKGAVPSQRSESMQLSHSITRNQKGDTRT
jgi:hypothetical protein